MSIIEATDVGPIRKLHHEIPDGFAGVLRFRGGHGAGKSTLLNCIRAALGGDVRIYPRELFDSEGDVTTKTGSVTVGDRKISVGMRTTKKGEVGYDSIEDRFDIEDLVTPHFDDCEARTQARIKALIGMRGSREKVGIDPFQAIVGGKEMLDGLLAPKDQDTGDLVRLCGKLKSAIEKKAREQETRAESAEENSRTAAAFAVGIDLTQPHDADVLTRAAAEALTKSTTMKNDRQAYLTAKIAYDTAKTRLTTHESQTTVTVAGAQAAYDEACHVKDQCITLIEVVERKLIELRGQLDAANNQVKSTKETLSAATNAEQAVAGWRDQVRLFEQLPVPDDAAIVAADTAYATAQESVDAGSKIRTAMAKLAEANRYDEQAEDFRLAAKKWREQANAVFGVLTQFLPPGPLRVEAGELVMDTDDRKSEQFDKLSAGEKTQVAVEYVISAIGDGGMGVLPQELWDGLNATAKTAVHRRVDEIGAILIVGEIAEGELRVEPFVAAAAEPKKSKAK